jgi:hypothetical protein
MSVVKWFGPADRREFGPGVWSSGLAGLFAAAGGLAGAERVGLGASVAASIILACLTLVLISRSQAGGIMAVQIPVIRIASTPTA